jgi:DNA-binding beta-propeller fold protein YncE
LSRLPFLATVAAVAILSFFWLAARSRPLRGGPGVEPVLYVSGLSQPRGLTVGPDGALYVAEGGWTGPGQNPVAGRVTRVTARNQSQVVVDGLPAAGAGQPLFAQSGPGALASDGAGLVLFLGPAEGRPQGSVARIPASSPEGGGLGESLPLVLENTPQASPSAPVSAVWGAQSLPAGSLPAVLPLANLLVRVDPGAGRAAPVTPFVGAGGSNPLPSGVARSPDGTLVVAHFGTAPFGPTNQVGGGRLVQVAADGRWQPLYENLRYPVGVAYSPGGLLFVAELASGYDVGGQRFLPRSGRVLALGPEPNRRRTVVRDVDYPTALAFGPNGDLYVAEGGVFRGPGEGRILFVPGQTLQGIR